MKKRGRPKGTSVLTEKVSVKFDQEGRLIVEELVEKTRSYNVAFVLRMGLFLHEDLNLPIHKKAPMTDKVTKNWLFCVGKQDKKMLKDVSRYHHASYMELVRSGVFHLYDKLIKNIEPGVGNVSSSSESKKESK